METAVSNRGSQRYTGVRFMLPGFLAVLLLVILPAFISLVSAVFGASEESLIEPKIASIGSIVLLKSLLAGAIGGILAALVGILLGWSLQGSRMKTLWLVLLCVPTIFGDVAASVLFTSSASWVLPEMLTRMLFILWRLTGPMTVLASLMMELTKGRLQDERISFGLWLKAGWRRWREYAGICLFSGMLMAIAGAGHVNAEMPSSMSQLTGPMEFIWSDITDPASTAWAVILWPFFLIMASGLLVFVRRLNHGLPGGPGVMERE